MTRTSGPALFQKAGARYVIPVAEHHDGFAMYDSALTPWCAGKMGPKRDLIGDLARAVRKQGLVFGVSSHRMEHHTFMYPALKIKTDLFDPKYAAFYGPPVPGDMNDGKASAAFQADWLARGKELVDKYQPQMVWFDNGVNSRAYDSVKLKFAAYYYNRAAQWGKAVSISTKSDAYLAGSILDFEKAVRAPKEILPGNWQVDDQIGNSWGYVTGMKYRTAGSIIGELADTVSKGGNLLINISPRADGTIPDEQQQILLAVGQWLGVNGEAIYGSRPWVKSGEGPYRFTTHAGALYAVVLGKPGPDMVIASLGTQARPDALVRSVHLLGQSAPLPFTQDTFGLHVTLPHQTTADTFPVLKIIGTLL